MLDLFLLRKDPDGSLEAMEFHEVDASLVGELREFEADLALLRAEQEVEDIGVALEGAPVTMRLDRSA